MRTVWLTALWVFLVWLGISSLAGLHPAGGVYENPASYALALYVIVASTALVLLVRAGLSESITYLLERGRR
jgi:hypothetical protein